MPPIYKAALCAMATTRLETLRKKQDQLKARIQALESRESEKERKEDTRRKILIGGFVLAHLKKNGLDAADFEIGGMRFFDTLRATRDRVLFGLYVVAEGEKDGE